eukprot:gene34304-42274_t
MANTMAVARSFIDALFHTLQGGRGPRVDVKQRMLAWLHRARGRIAARPQLCGPVSPAVSPQPPPPRSAPQPHQTPAASSLQQPLLAAPLSRQLPAAAAAAADTAARTGWLGKGTFTEGEVHTLVQHFNP